MIRSGTIESTAKPRVGLRLKGPGLHGSERGALAVTALRATDLRATALRATDLNGHWHQLWTTLTLNA